jgi:hypothetical protein
MPSISREEWELLLATLLVATFTAIVASVLT